MRTRLLVLTLSLSLTAAASPPANQPAHPPATQSANSPASQPESIVLYFDFGSAAIRPQDEALLDKAARTFRAGQPIVMLVAGATDAVGAANLNLQLSADRANAVIHGLEARGIPAQRLQLLAKGESEPAVKAQDKEQSNRRAEITWR